MADAATSRGASTAVRSIDDVEPDEVTSADALICGCWMPGKVPFGDEPALRMATWVAGLPPLDGTPVGVFCAYRFFRHTFADTATRTAETEGRLANEFELKGAKVVATQSLHTRSLDAAATVLVEGVLAHMH